MQALTPLTIGRSSAKASLLGALWGFGHSTGQLILGLLMVVRFCDLNMKSLTWQQAASISL